MIKKFIQQNLRKIELVAVTVMLVTSFALWSAKAGNHENHVFNSPVASNNAGATISPSGSFAPIVKNALPAVVNIASSKIIKASDNSMQMPFQDDPLFQQFFGRQFRSRPRDQHEQGLGSGVIINSDGYILTNNHVVEGASDIRIYTSDKRELKAHIIGADPRSDIAVIKVEAKDLPALPIGDSSQVEVGDIVLAIGNPFGVGQTVTMGIVSATGRGNLGIEDYEDFIETDAAINPGNSGGALINTRGELVGINTAILANGSNGNQGVGFAVPANQARQVMDQIISKGRVERGYMGVMIQEVTPSVAKAFNLDQVQGGALVGDVTEGSPAARAGIQKGDIILELNGRRVADSRELRLKISQMAPGSDVRMRIFRDGSRRDVELKLGELPNDQARATERGASNSPISGIAVDNLNAQILRELNLPSNTSGVVITGIEPGSAAEAAGLQRGDVIQEVNRRPVTSTTEFDRALRSAGNESILLLVNKGGRTSYIVLDQK